MPNSRYGDLSGYRPCSRKGELNDDFSMNVKTRRRIIFRSADKDVHDVRRRNGRWLTERHDHPEESVEVGLWQNRSHQSLCERSGRMENSDAQIARGAQSPNAGIRVIRSTTSWQAFFPTMLLPTRLLGKSAC